MERTRGCHLSSHRGCLTLHSPPSHGNTHLGRDNEHKKNQVSSSMDMHWKGANCAVCMEPPHNAVLLLCSSHEKGCRPYMCNTSYQHSNCLELFKKAYTVSMSTDQKTFSPLSSAVCKKLKSLELPCPQCPLCRGQVKGWTVIMPARKYLNNKKRSCMQGDCSFVGTFIELQNHMRENHPFVRPQEVDPQLQKKWRELVLETERQDAISIIASLMPNSVILGDYVIDREDHSETEYYRDDRLYTEPLPRRRYRRKRIVRRWMLGFRPSFARFAWKRMHH